LLEHIGTGPSHLLPGLDRSFSDAPGLLGSFLACAPNCVLGGLNGLILLAWICHL
jgi:hypothetical protein